eukprot:jgi/Galph1/1656/GphlegSOOS_G344.1
MSRPVQQIALDRVGELLESPFWNSTTNSLYFVDINGKSIHQYEIHTAKHRTWNTSQRIGFISPVAHRPQVDVILGGMEDGLYLFDREEDNQLGLQEQCVWKLDPSLSSIVRFNDGKCDASGRLFAGTMDYQWRERTSQVEAKGQFYRFDSSRRHCASQSNIKESSAEEDALVKSTVLLSEISCSNGLTWSGDHRNLFYIDSGKLEISCYPFDIGMGTIDTERKQSVATLTREDGDNFTVFDGLCSDVQDKLWVALPGSGSILQLDPTTGKELLRISVGCKYPTSVCFGGPHLDILFVTSLRETQSSNEWKYQGGSLFMLEIPGTRGSTSSSAFVI